MAESEVKTVGQQSTPAVQTGTAPGPKSGAPDAGATDKTGPDTTGTEYAEFKDPQDAARFKRIYGHVKRNERIIGVMASDNRALFDANQKLVDRLANLEKFLTEKGSADAIVLLTRERQAAIDSGDLARVADLSDKIAEVKVKTELHKARQVKPQPRLTPQPLPPQDFLGDDRRVAFQAWADERTPDGGFERPWAREGHPKFQRAVEMAASVLNDPEYQDASNEMVLREVDRLMGHSKTKKAAVLSGHEGTPGKTKETRLNADQLAVAKKMGIDPDRYAQSMHKYKRA